MIRVCRFAENKRLSVAMESRVPEQLVASATESQVTL